ncbi:universal stress protein [Dactylosporangium sp. NPDC000244]|uniref:universal stress protein n=1 Tax=Dactylosporangium sp. NPDC000244 TaxID=3154365 RepID=UPI00331DAC22
MTTESMPAAAVVVGVDGSHDGARAVRWAAADAARRHRPLHLVHACGAPPDLNPPVGPAVPVACQEEARQIAERTVAGASVQARDVAADLRITTEIVADRPVPALLNAARNASVLVVGNRGLGGFAALLVGSTGVQLAAHAECPVVIVRRPDRPDGPEAGRVVVGVDGSHDAEHALRFAFEQAAFRDTGLTAVHGYWLPVRVEAGGITAVAYDEDEVREERRRVVSESLAGWRENYPDVDVRLNVVPRLAGGALSDAAAGAELLVVGARGHGGFPGLHLGSVSQAMLHHAPCPVAVVREPHSPPGPTR